MKSLFFFALLLTLACCTTETGRQRDALLDRADSMNRAYVPMTGGLDSLLLEAANYYDRHGTANEQVRAHYLLGCAYRDMGEAPVALQCYQDAVDRADTLSPDCDYRRLMSVYGQMAELFHAQNLPEDELEQREQCRQCALHLKDTLMLIRCVELKAKAYFLLQDTTSMINSLLRARQLYNDYGFNEQAAAIYPPIIDVCIGRDSLEKAKELMDIFESKSGLFDSDGNICAGRESYYELKGLYYCKTHQIDSAEVYFRKLLLQNNISFSAEAYKGLLSVFKEKENTDSAKKFVQLFENAVNKERADIQTRTIHQMYSLYNYHRFLEKAHVERIRAEHIKTYLLLSLLLIAVIIFTFVVIVLNLAHKKKMREKETEDIKKEYANIIENKERIENELNMLRANYAQLVESEETAKNTLANAKANYAKLIREKGKEIAVLNGNIREFAKRFLPADKLAIDNPRLSILIDDFHRKATRKKNTSMPLGSEWEQLIRLFARLQPAAYATIGREAILSQQELKACVSFFCLNSRIVK